LTNDAKNENAARATEQECFIAIGFPVRAGGERQPAMRALA
jgi:hypothetical protein